MDGTTGEVVLAVHQGSTRTAPFEESGNFSNFTFQFTDKLDVQLGARYASYDQEFEQAWIGVGAPVASRRSSHLL
jgi:hypothetical protein